MDRHPRVTFIRRVREKLRVPRCRSVQCARVQRIKRGREREREREREDEGTQRRKLTLNRLKVDSAQPLLSRSLLCPLWARKALKMAVRDYNGRNGLRRTAVWRTARIPALTSQIWNNYRTSCSDKKRTVNIMCQLISRHN